MVKLDDAKKMEKLTIIKDNLKEVIDTNEQILPLLGELRKQGAELQDSLADIRSFEASEIDRIRKVEESIGLEQIEERLKQLEGEEEISDKLIETLMHAINYQTTLLSEFEELVWGEQGGKGNDLLKRHLEYLDALLKGEAIIENEEELRKYLSDVIKLADGLRNAFENENSRFEKAKTIEQNMIHHVKRLQMLSSDIDKLLQELKDTEKEALDEARKLRALTKDEFTVKELTRIVDAALKLIEIAKMEKPKQKELYRMINLKLRQGKKILKFKFNKVIIKFRIIGIELTRIKLIQLDRKGDNISEIFNRYRGIFGRMGLGEGYFREFVEEKSKLEEGLKSRLNAMLELFMRQIKTYPDHAVELAKITAQELGIVTDEDIKKILISTTPEKIKEFKSKLAQENLDEAYSQKGEKGGLAGMIEYARPILHEIHEEYKKEPRGSEIWRALAEIYNKAMIYIEEKPRREGFMDEEIISLVNEMKLPTMIGQ